MHVIGFDHSWYIIYMMDCAFFLNECTELNASSYNKSSSTKLEKYLILRKKLILNYIFLFYKCKFVYKDALT